MIATTNPRTDAAILTAVKGTPAIRRAADLLHAAIAGQAGAADPRAWDDAATRTRRLLAARLRDNEWPDVEYVMNACTRAIRAEHGGAS